MKTYTIHGFKVMPLESTHEVYITQLNAGLKPSKWVCKVYSRIIDREYEIVFKSLSKARIKLKEYFKSPYKKVV